jgi:hypothetical protein
MIRMNTCNRTIPRAASLALFGVLVATGSWSCTNDEQAEPVEPTNVDSVNVGQNSGTSGGTARWVLRDADGTPVQALVRPYVRPDGDEAPFDTYGAIDCVEVFALGDSYLPRPRYHLETGSMLPCYGEPPNRFGSALCSERLAETKHQIIRDGEELFIGTTKTEGNVYLSSSSSGDCIERSPGLSWALEPLPETIQNELSNAPYSLTVEYQ